ncbi:MAG TPA: hypothetical protein VIG36_01660, partial [Methylocystis sp.]
AAAAGAMGFGAQYRQLVRISAAQCAIYCAAATNFSASRNYCCSGELNPKSGCGLSSANHYVVDMLANFRREAVTAFG